MIQIDCDFHIHSRFSAATSRNMTLENISSGAAQKGLGLIATGDALHKQWLDEMESLSFKDGVAKLNDTHFIATTEVEDRNRVHHLLIFNGMDSILQMRDGMKKSTANMDSDGRPHTRLKGEEIAGIAHDCGAMIGPSHAFVPWTSIYKEFDSLHDCYGMEKVDFLELGLSADTEMANNIEELQNVSFLSNSDAHSPSPHRLGREFNRLSIEKLNFNEIKKALHNKEGREIILNVGLDARLGKYHRTACIKCYTHFNLEEALKNKWRCPFCRGRIKKGVLERIQELGQTSKIMKKRPPYLRIATLAEIIAASLDLKSPYSLKVTRLWTQLVESFGSEITVLIDAPTKEVASVNKLVAEKIDMYRKKHFTIEEGGGGKYGELVFDTQNPPLKAADSKQVLSHQINLDKF